MEDLPEILSAFEKTLELERELGTRTVDIDRALLLPVRRVEAMPPPTANREPPTTGHDSPTTSHEPRAMPTIEELAACTKCPLASLGRRQVVPGQGNADSPDIMFIGEAPGAEEDRQGLAFVGAAGQFLTKMIMAMGYTREQVFIANVCKCRPPNNRTPNPQEMVACLPYLKRQIGAIRPKCIVLLGRTAANGLFPAKRIPRSVWYEYEGIPTIATFHPSYIIRFDPMVDPVGLRTAKTEVWNTLKMVLARLGRPVPQAKRNG